ncbi:MAG: chemotaxis response regulator protein-glutamate methylesterase [Thermodesulfobacteriota bacterium]
MKKIKVLVVDDSPLMLAWLKNIFSSDPAIEEVFSAQNPFEAKGILRKQTPDVITLDVEMPGMDGISFLKEIMAEHPLPVIMVSAYTKENSQITIKALSLGAVDFISKPGPGEKEEKESFPGRLLNMVREAALARTHPSVSEFPEEDVRRAREDRELLILNLPRIVIGIGASTGGTQALNFLLTQVPARMPPLVIVQHMPGRFTGAFSEHLNQNSPLAVKEAKSGDRLAPGSVLVVPGDFHGLVRKDAGGFFLTLNEGSPVNHHRPSVDVLFYSLAETAKEKAVGILLTGMGEDGARGLLAMRKQGAKTLVQDEATSTVFGMPRAAINLGAAQAVVPLGDFPRQLINSIRT